MSSSEEERLVQMVHDFIESDSSPPIFSASPESLSLSRRSNYLTLLEILKNRTEAETEVLENVLKYTSNKMDAEKSTTLKKWLAMRLKMDGYIASLCQTSWVNSSACPGGAYEYIDVIIQDHENGHRLIVDIEFKSQFELARPTPTYKKLSDTLPHIFVGSEDKLVKMISLLCSAAKQSLKERGLHIPPWRTSTYMMSKWLSDCHKLDPDALAFSRQNKEAIAEATDLVVRPKRRDLGGGGSGLSSQFSNMSINCC